MPNNRNHKQRTKKYQITLKTNNTPTVLRTTLKKNTTSELEPHFLSKCAFKASLNRSYQMDHPHNILYGNSKPNTSIFMPLNVLPNDTR